MHRCAILDDYQDAAFGAADWSPLTGRVELSAFSEHIGDRDELALRLAPFDIIVAMRERTPFDAALLARLPRLKLLVTTGMANASIDLAAAARHGVVVSGTPGSAGATAELAWGLLIAVMRQIPQENANLRAGGARWQQSVGRDLRGLRLGIVGLGRLGTRVARYGLAFEMQVVAWSRSATPESTAALGIAHAPSLDDLLATSHVVSIHLPLNPATRGLIGRRELGLMKPEAVIINTARGPIVDEAALIEALDLGRLGGAGLDVFDREPLPAGHPFRTLPSVVATPHLGYVTRDGYRVFFAGIVEDIAAWLDGAPLRVLTPT